MMDESVMDESSVCFFFFLRVLYPVDSVFSFRSCTVNHLFICIIEICEEALDIVFFISYLTCFIPEYNVDELCL